MNYDREQFVRGLLANPYLVDEVIRIIDRALALDYEPTCLRCGRNTDDPDAEEEKEEHAWRPRHYVIDDRLDRYALEAVSDIVLALFEFAIERQDRPPQPGAVTLHMAGIRERLIWREKVVYRAHTDEELRKLAEFQAAARKAALATAARAGGTTERAMLFDVSDNV